MESFSNKTLAGLLIIAVIVSLTGTLISLDKFNKLQAGLLATGLAVYSSTDSNTNHKVGDTLEQHNTSVANIYKDKYTSTHE